VLDVLPVAARRAWHARAASVLAEGGAPPARIAVHLAAGEPVGEEWALHALRASAREARAQGAAGAAADLLACALREPLSDADRASVLAELGRMEVAAGRPEGFERLRAVGQLADDPEAAGRIALDLADGLAHATRYAEALEVVDSALGEPAGLSSELELRLEAVRGIAVRYQGPGDGDRERVVRRAGLVTGATPAERLLRATAAMVGPAERASDAVLAADLVREAWPEGLLPADTLSGGMTALVHADELEGARSWLDEVLADLRRRGRIADLARLLTLRGWVMCERGDLRASETDLREAFDLGLALFPGPPAAHLAVTLALSGRVDEAQAVLTGAALEQPALPENMLFNVVLYARGVVRAAAGRRDEAIDDLLELGSRHGRWELSRPVPPWRSAAAELLAAAGETTDAGRLAREELELAQRWGTARARGIALRTLAFLETGSDAIDLLESSVAELERSQGRLELARSLVELGAALRRSRRRVDARDPLRHGMDLAHAGGASPLAERARIELAATGARPRRLALTGLDALTPSERRVAELVATGMTNRETAQALFVTLPTVETHLRHVFQKLDLSSRTELAEALEDPRSPA
jgi:DNA-binding CsgD family transcriptional regulator/tetratricopeptide (TPR) repeat protein